MQNRHLLLLYAWFTEQKDFDHFLLHENLLVKCLKDTTLFAAVKVDLSNEHNVEVLRCDFWVSGALFWDRGVFRFWKSGWTNLEKTEGHQRPVLRDSGGRTTVVIMT